MTGLDLDDATVANYNQPLWKHLFGAFTKQEVEVASYHWPWDEGCLLKDCYATAV